MSCDRDETTIMQTLESYQAWHQAQNSTVRTVQIVKERVGRFALWHGPESALTMVTPGDVAGYFRHLRELGLASGTLAGHKATNKAFWSWCHQRSLVDRNPATILDNREFAYSFRPARSTAAKPLDVEAVVDIIPEFAESGRPRDVRDAALVSMAIDSAARRGELHNLRRADGMAALRQNQITDDGLSVYHCKGQGQTGDVLIRFYQDTADLLATWLDCMPAGANWLWVNTRTGERLRAAALATAFERLCEHAGVPVFRFHSVRKRVVTDIIRESGDVKMGQLLANHRDPRSTLAYCGDIDQHQVDKMAGRLAAYRRHGEDWSLVETAVAFFGKVDA